MKTLFIFFLALFAIIRVDAQVQSFGFKDYSFSLQTNVGTGTPNVTHPSAWFEMGPKTNNSKKGFLPPRGFKDSIQNPYTSLTIFDWPTKKYWVFNGTAWEQMGTGAGGGSVDLTAYYTKTSTDSLLAGYYTKTNLQTSGGALVHWGNITNAPSFLTSYTESDPVWSAAIASYYTKTNLQTSGGALVHWGNITNAPSFLSNITGLVQPGTNMTRTGSGTTGDPYIFNSTATGGTGSSQNLAQVTAIGKTTPDHILTGGLSSTGPGQDSAIIKATQNFSASTYGSFLQLVPTSTQLGANGTPWMVSFRRAINVNPTPRNGDHDNYVFDLGTNMTASGAISDPNRPAWRMQFEANYQTTSDDSTMAGEQHLIFHTPTFRGVPGQDYRLTSWGVNHQANAAYMYQTGTRFWHQDMGGHQYQLLTADGAQTLSGDAPALQFTGMSNGTKTFLRFNGVDVLQGTKTNTGISSFGIAPTTDTIYTGANYISLNQGTGTRRVTLAMQAGAFYIQPALNLGNDAGIRWSTPNADGSMPADGQQSFIFDKVVSQGSATGTQSMKVRVNGVDNFFSVVQSVGDNGGTSLRLTSNNTANRPTTNLGSNIHWNSDSGRVEARSPSGVWRSLAFIGDNGTGGTGGGMAIGGAITSSTVKSVLFVGTSNVLQQDNTYFNYDNVNKRLVIGNHEFAGGNSTSMYFYNQGGTFTTRSGSNNTFMGYATSGGITSGSGNTTMGAYSGGNLTTGAENTFMGDNAGANVSTGNYNTFLGNRAGAGVTGSYNTIIGSVNVANVPSSLNYSIHIVAADGYAGNTGVNIPTARHVFIGGGSNSSVALQTYYFGQSPLTAEAASVPINFNAPSGLGTNIGGASFTINAGRGTGNAIGGDIILQTSSVTTSGTTLQSLSPRITIKADSGYIILNSGSTPTFADDTAAGAAGLSQGTVYKTSTGHLMIKL